MLHFCCCAKIMLEVLKTSALCPNFRPLYLLKYQNITFESMNNFKRSLALVICLFPLFSMAQKAYLLKPDRVFDGDAMHERWEVLVKGNKIIAVGASVNISSTDSVSVVELRGCTLLPGLIEGHSHLFLHPYNETSWNDQVLKESRVERTARAVEHARLTLLAGFTTVRDLGTEGAMYDDVSLKKTIEKGLIPGPRMLVATRAIVALGAYGPKGDTPDQETIKGAAEVGNSEELLKEARLEIGKGADLIKVYADYRVGRNNERMATFSADELKQVVEMANSMGRAVVVHSSTKDGMRRSIAAGVTTIEHGDDADAEIFKLMKSKNVAYCPTLAAGESILQYNGWKKGQDPEPLRITQKKKSFQQAVALGVRILMGGDVGVFSHGNNALEMELMVEYGMKPIDVLKSATAVNADTFGIGKQLGRIQPGLLADLVAVTGNPAENIKVIRKPQFVMKDGKVYLNGTK
jgi:imidazolonepropionase-like amidohydrolase